MKKLIVYILSLIILISSVNTKVIAQEINKCGENARWSISAEGEMIIEGNGTVTKCFLEDSSFDIEKVKTITIKEGIVEIGKECFWNFYNLEKVSIAGTVEKIGAYAFRDCENLKELSIPDSITYIGKQVFANCENLEEVRLSQNLSSISEGVFLRCRNIKEIKLPTNIKTIGKSAFSDCDGIEKIKIPDSVTKIKKGAFSNCDNLKVITIGKSVNKISKSFIKNSISLRKIINKSNIEIPLYDFNGKITWKVSKKKVTSLPAGKTAYAKGKKYKINYHLNKGKVKSDYIKNHRYGRITLLPNKVKRKGYTFFGWNVSSKNNWAYLTNNIKKYMYGNINAYAQFKKYKVRNVKGNKIKVTVKDCTYNSKDYNKETDAYVFRYSEYKDMRDAKTYVFTYPYSKGVSKKLKKGKTYYVQVALMPNSNEDIEDPISDWIMTKKVTINK